MAKPYQPRFDFRYSPTLSEYLMMDQFIRVVVGPLGSGKTTASCAGLMGHAMRQRPDPKTNVRRSRYAVVRNTSPELKSTTIKTWLEHFPEEAVGPMRMGSPITHRIKVKPQHGEPGLDAEFLFVPLDKPGDVKKLKSLELTAAFVNEASEVPESVIQMLRGRVGRFPPAGRAEAVDPCIYMDTNAPDEDHHLAQKHLYERPHGWGFVRQPPAVLQVEQKGGQWTVVEPEPHLRGQVYDPGKVVAAAGRNWVVNPGTENAPFLRRNYYRDQLSGARLDWIRAYLQSRYVYVQDGKPVIDEYSDDIFSFEDLPVLSEQELVLGIDIGGGTLNPAAVIGQTHPRGAHLIHDEVFGSDLGIKNFSRILKERIQQVAPGKMIRVGWGDPAMTGRDELYEVAVADHLQAEGIPAFPAPSNDPALRIEAIKNACGTMIDGKPGVMIHRRCKNLRKALNGAWQYKRVQVGGEERYHETPNKNHPYSDLADALGYMLMGAGGHADLTGRGNSRNREASRAVIDFEL